MCKKGEVAMPTIEEQWIERAYKQAVEQGIKQGIEQMIVQF